MNTKYIVLSFVAGILFAGCLSSCWTFIGYGVGAWADNGAAHDTVPIFRNISSYTGQAARIRYPSIRYATFEDYSDEPADTYRKNYDRYVESHSTDPAAIVYGDTVITRSFKYKGAFGGYFPEGIFLHDEKIYLDDFATMITRKPISKTDLMTLFESNAIPIRATLNFRDKNNDFALTNRDFQNVFVLPHNAPGRWIGLGIGAAADLAIAIWFANLADAGPKPFSFAKAHYNGGVMH